MTISAIDRKELDAKPELLHRTNPPTPPPQLTESPYVVTAIFEPVKQAIMHFQNRIHHRPQITIISSTFKPKESLQSSQTGNTVLLTTILCPYHLHSPFCLSTEYTTMAVSPYIEFGDRKARQRPERIKMRVLSSHKFFPTLCAFYSTPFSFHTVRRDNQFYLCDRAPKKRGSRTEWQGRGRLEREILPEKKPRKVW